MSTSPAPLSVEPTSESEQLRRLQEHASGALDLQFAAELERETDLVELIKRLVSTHYSHMCFMHAGELADRVRADVTELNITRQVLSPIAKEIGTTPFVPSETSVGTGAAVKTLVDRAGSSITQVDPILRMLEDINSNLYPGESFPTRFALVTRLKKDIAMAKALKPAAVAAAKSVGYAAKSSEDALDTLLTRLVDLHTKNLELKRENLKLKEKAK